MAKKPGQKQAPTSEPKSTLYCSFCGKSQFEVLKLIAGPTVFICDECAELVVDIIQREPTLPNITPGEGGRNILTVRVPLPDKMDATEFATLSGLVKSVESAFPSCTISIIEINSLQNFDVITLEVDGSPEYDPQKLAQQVRELTVALHVERQKLIAETSYREGLEIQLDDIRKALFPAAIEALKIKGVYPNTTVKTMSVLFLDVSGFSTMSELERIRSVDMLRSLGRVIINSEQGMYINTWGDAIVAAFENPSEALRCGCKFIQHFGLAGMDARVGVAWGAIRISTNEIRQAHDIDGEAVNFGARLEAAADLGVVVCSAEFPSLLGEKAEDFVFSPRQISLRKPVGDLPAGTAIDVFEVRMRPN